jgi:hypothetical protein
VHKSLAHLQRPHRVCCSSLRRWIHRADESAPIPCYYYQLHYCALEVVFPCKPTWLKSRYRLNEPR